VLVRRLELHPDTASVSAVRCVLCTTNLPCQPALLLTGGPGQGVHHAAQGRDSQPHAPGRGGLSAEQWRGGRAQRAAQSEGGAAVRARRAGEAWPSWGEAARLKCCLCQVAWSCGSGAEKPCTAEAAACTSGAADDAVLTCLSGHACTGGADPGAAHQPHGGG
jgi:hypothetical protein